MGGRVGWRIGGREVERVHTLGPSVEGTGYPYTDGGWEGEGVGGGGTAATAARRMKGLKLNYFLIVCFPLHLH